MKNSPVETTSVQYASPPLSRIFAAMVYDGLLLAAVSIAYGALVVGIHVLINGQPEAGQRIQWGLTLGILISIGWLFTLAFFFIYFWHKFGQTLGMKTWRLQMIDSQTLQLADFKKCCIRSAVASISLLFFGIGYWYRWFHPQQKMLHDVISGTQIILLKKRA
ncbi:MAG: RDD family protein [Moraxellaceae bacterium]|nr:MAG: RDD family protein [Moraxellaceae bacterium]